MKSIVEYLAVTIVFLMIATAFFATMDDRISLAQETRAQYQEKLLKDAAYTYVQQHGFSPHTDDPCSMTVYIWEQDGRPALESVVDLHFTVWFNVMHTKYIGIEMNRCADGLTIADNFIDFRILEEKR